MDRLLHSLLLTLLFHRTIFSDDCNLPVGDLVKTSDDQARVSQVVVENNISEILQCPAGQVLQWAFDANNQRYYATFKFYCANDQIFIGSPDSTIADDFILNSADVTITCVFVTKTGKLELPLNSQNRPGVEILLKGRSIDFELNFLIASERDDIPNCFGGTTPSDRKTLIDILVSEGDDDVTKKKKACVVDILGSEYEYDDVNGKLVYDLIVPAGSRAYLPCRKNSRWELKDKSTTTHTSKRVQKFTRDAGGELKAGDGNALTEWDCIDACKTPYKLRLKALNWLVASLNEEEWSATYQDLSDTQKDYLRRKGVNSFYAASRLLTNILINPPPGDDHEFLFDFFEPDELRIIETLANGVTLSGRPAIGGTCPGEGKLKKEGEDVGISGNDPLHGASNFKIGCVKIGEEFVQVIAPEGGDVKADSPPVEEYSCACNVEPAEQSTDAEIAEDTEPGAGAQPGNEGQNQDENQDAPGPGAQHGN